MTDRPVRPVLDDVDAWLTSEGVDDDGSLRAIDAVVRAALPAASRRLWRGTFWGGTEQAIVGYGDITQPRPRDEDAQWFMLGLARQQRHVSLYVNAVEGRAYLSKRYAPRLAVPGARVKAGAAALTFAKASDLDMGVLGELVEHAARVQPYR